MIRPSKYTNLNLSIVKISAEIIKYLSKNQIAKYDEILEWLSKKSGDEVKHVYISSLNFLYLIGKIEYHTDSDSIELLIKN